MGDGVAARFMNEAFNARMVAWHVRLGTQFATMMRASVAARFMDDRVRVRVRVRGRGPSRSRQPGSGALERRRAPNLGWFPVSRAAGGRVPGASFIHFLSHKTTNEAGRVGVPCVSF